MLRAIDVPSAVVHPHFGSRSTIFIKPSKWPQPPSLRRPPFLLPVRGAAVHRCCRVVHGHALQVDARLTVPHTAKTLRLLPLPSLLALCRLGLCGTLGVAACGTTYVNNTASTGTDGSATVPPDSASSNSSDCNNANLQSDSNNCGRCNNRCVPPNNARGSLCVSAVCTPWCWDNFHFAASTSTCEPNVTTGCGDVSTDPNNCGSCGNVCAAPANASRVSCAGGKCLPSCNAGFKPVANLNACECENTQTDSNNCGSCGHVCPVPAKATGVSCANSLCIPQCTSGYHPAGQQCVADTECGGANTNTDVNNCGSCGNKCERRHASAVCDTGSCVYTCDNGYETVLNPSTNKNECLAKCPGDQSRCPLNVLECRIPSQDLNNCGGCNTVCPDNTANGGSRICKASNTGQYYCAISCPTGFYVPSQSVGCQACPNGASFTDGSGNRCGAQQ